MFKTTVSGIVAHKLRLALTALAVVLGVGFVSGTLILSDTLRSTFDQLFDTASEGVDVSVRSKAAFDGSDTAEREPVPDTLLAQVRDIPGVEVAAGNVNGYAQLVDKQGEAVSANEAPTLGVTWMPEQLNPLKIRDGKAPANAEDIAVDAHTADEHGFRVGDRVKVLLQGPAREFRITAIVKFGEADNLAGATLVAFHPPTAQEVFGRKGRFDSIEVHVDNGADAELVRNAIARILPQGAEAVPGQTVADENSDSINSELGMFTTALTVFGVVSLFVGAFIIFNTFSILVAQRTRELALLRALGASRRQVTLSVLAEALMTGVLASAVGVLFGLLVAVGLQGLLKAFGIELPGSGTVFKSQTAVIGMILGTVVTAVSALVPARRASGVPPVAAMRDQPPSTGGSMRTRFLAGTAVTAVGAAMILFGLFGDVDNGLSLVGLGALVLFIGVAALAPMTTRPVAQVLGAPLSRFAGLPGRLARDNAMRNPKRTSATAAALMIGLALVAFMSIFAASAKTSLDQNMRGGNKSDYVLLNEQFQGFSPELTRALNTRSEIAAATAFRYGDVQIGTSKKSIVAIDKGAGRTLDVDMTEGSFDDLRPGTVLVYKPTADDKDLSIGDTVTMKFARTGDQRLRVAGIYEDKALLDSDYLLNSDDFRANFTNQLDMVVLVKGARGVQPADLRPVIESVSAAFPNVEVKTADEFIADQKAQMDMILGMVFALLFLAIAIAVLGIMNTLALSILERTREVGLLRAVGMSRRQLRRMIRWESVIIGVLGAVLGTVVGIFFGWTMVKALADNGFGEFTLPVGQLTLFIVFAALAGMVAAIFPARRAARLDVLHAISHH